jgi:hypothetical protein
MVSCYSAFSDFDGGAVAQETRARHKNTTTAAAAKKLVFFMVHSFRWLMVGIAGHCCPRIVWTLDNSLFWMALFLQFSELDVPERLQRRFDFVLSPGRLLIRQRSER